MSLINLNDLFDYGYFIYQNDDYFKFSIDSVLLAEFVNIRKGKNKILDLCSGNAPIPMILQKKYGDLDITGVELQKEVYELAISSLEYNNITSVTILNDDVNNIKNIFKNKKFDVVVCNPPYFKIDEGSMINDNSIKAIARHEIKLNLNDLILNVSKVIQNQGYFYMVHLVTRFSDVVNVLKMYNFGIKRLVFIHDDKYNNATLFLVEAMFNGKDYVNVLPPVFVNEHKSFKNIFER